MGRRQPALVALLTYIVLASACASPCASSSPDAPPVPTIAVSEEAATRVETKTAGLPGHSFEIELTDEEVTSYVALRLNDILPLEHPQVRFLPDQFILEGDLTRPIRTHVTLSGTAAVSAGRPVLDLECATIGRFSLPRLLLASVSDSLLETVNLDDAPLTLETIAIEQGHITIAGRAG